jgi:mannosyltransferase OCH1-like enzyme
MPIPKITHQIWMQGWDNLPPAFQTNVERLHEVNPDYQHMKWDEKSLRRECQKYSNACMERFDSFEYLHSKIDLGRYVVLYNYGGISVDTDMVPLRPIRHTPYINTDDFLISYQSYPYNLLGLKNNALIICSQNHFVLRAAIEAILSDSRTPADFILKELYIDRTTGPIFLGKIVDSYRAYVKVLDYKYYEPCSISDGSCEISSESIMDHRHEMSWMSGWYKFMISLSYIIIHSFWYLLIIGVGSLTYFIYKYPTHKSKYRR